MEVEEFEIWERHRWLQVLVAFGPLVPLTPLLYRVSLSGDGTLIAMIFAATTITLLSAHAAMTRRSYLRLSQNGLSRVVRTGSPVSNFFARFFSRDKGPDVSLTGTTTARIVEEVEGKHRLRLLAFATPDGERRIPLLASGVMQVRDEQSLLLALRKRGISVEL